MFSPLVLVRPTKQKIRRDVECSNLKATLLTDSIQLRMYVQTKEWIYCCIAYVTEGSVCCYLVQVTVPEFTRRTAEYHASLDSRSSDLDLKKESFEYVVRTKTTVGLCL